MNSKYETWIAKVNWEIEKICDVGIDDINRYYYRDAFEDGLDARTVARRAVKNAGLYI